MEPPPYGLKLALPRIYIYNHGRLPREKNENEVPCSVRPRELSSLLDPCPESDLGVHDFVQLLCDGVWD